MSATKNRPWFKFYAQDWRGDQSLRACSLGARGLWIEMLTLAHEAAPYGYVLINGNAPDIPTLARVVGVSESDCESFIDELERHGVFSRTRGGTIYSRKMVRGAQKDATAQKNGKLGGNPSLLNQREISASVNPPVKGLDKAQIPDTRINNKNGDARQYEGRSSGEWFEDFWREAAKRKDSSQNRRRRARELFMQYMREGISPVAIINGAMAYKRMHGNSEYVQSPNNWLRERGWENTAPQPAPRKTRGELMRQEGILA